MAIPEWIVIVIMILLSVGIFSFVMYVIIEIISGTLKKKLYKGLVHNDLNFSDFKNLQLNLNLSDRNVHSALINMKSELDFSEDERRSVLKPKLDVLIKEFNNNKPFSELPSGLVEPLTKAKSNSSEPKIIDDLSEKILIHLKRQKRSDFLIKLATYIGLFLGFIGTASNYLK
ncbi:hypothetical protein [Serratia proteamaculans]